MRTSHCTVSRERTERWCLELASRDDVETVRLELNDRSAEQVIRASEFAFGEALGYRPYDTTRRTAGPSLFFKLD